eukprot:4542684-Prymnesium_polylepis.3
MPCFASGKQPLAHEYHRAILKGCDPRPLEWRLLEEGVAELCSNRGLEVRHMPQSTAHSENNGSRRPLVYTHSSVTMFGIIARVNSPCTSAS